MKKRTRTTIIVMGIAILAIATLATWQLGYRQVPLPEGLIQANGRIEGDHYTAASKVPGKIVEIKTREGDAVEGGQVLARLNDTQVHARMVQAEQSLSAAEAQCKVVEALEQQEHRDKERLRNLLAKGTATKQESERSELAWAVARDQTEVARAQCEVARATLVEVQSVLDDLTIRAPASGIVTTRVVNKGEVVAAGSPLFDIVDLDRLYLKVYIPEKDIGKVRLGLLAHIYTDAFPDLPFVATVRYIASRAEFTPKEVQTPDERVKLVFAVKLYLDENPDHRLTPGLPADAVIRWQEDTPWAKPRW